MKWNLFDLNKDGKGVLRNEDKTPNLKYYFKLLWRNFSRLLTINLIAVFQFAPLLAAFLVYFWEFTAPSITKLSYPLFYGISQMDSSPAIQVLAMLSSPQYALPPWISPRLMLILGSCILVFALFWGWFNVGFTYLLRELINGRPVFIFSDLKYSIKKNAKQGFLLGLLDAFLIVVLCFNIFNMGTGSTDGFLGDFFYVANVAIALIYVIIRFYIYLMAITFDMKISKIFKNALIFVMLGIKRNLMAILGVVMMIATDVALIIVFTPLGVILPFFVVPMLPMFTATYAAYPVIKKYMIDPLPQDVEENEDTEDLDSFDSDEGGITADEMWKLFLAESGLDEDATYLSRGFSRNDAASILSGEKTALSYAHPIISENKALLPQIGAYSVVLNDQDEAVCVLQTTKVYVVKYGQINEEHAQKECLGDKSLKTWKKLRKELFETQLQEKGLEFSEDLRILCEEFKVVYPI